MFNYCPLLLVKTHIQPDRDYSNAEINHLQTRQALILFTMVHNFIFLRICYYQNIIIKWQQMVVTLTISVNQSYGYDSSGIGTPGD